MEQTLPALPEPVSFFDRPGAHVHEIPVGEGVPLGYEIVANPAVKSAGVYGTWGKACDNQRVMELVEGYIGEPLQPAEKMDLAAVGFTSRHHTPDLSPEEHTELEVQAGSVFLRQAANACGWETDEVDAVLIGATVPVCEDFLERVAARAGIRPDALKVSIHKACDGSIGALHLSLNPALAFNGRVGRNLAQELHGKKVLVGGIEGLSRLVAHSNDRLALQLFGNGAGVIGLVPGETMQFLSGRTHEVYDEQGVLGLRMFYPHSGRKEAGTSNIEVSSSHAHHIRVAGLMNEPADGAPISMAGPMGMVKLFVRSGVQVVRQVYQDYREAMTQQGHPEQQIRVAIVHHANLKINRLKQKTLNDEGIPLEMPWLLSDFGNVSAASGMIAYLRKLPELQPGDHILFDGFGAGTYYDVLVVRLAD